MTNETEKNQTAEEAALDLYNQLCDQARELVEQGDVASARRVFAEADKVRP